MLNLTKSGNTVTANFDGVIISAYANKFNFQYDNSGNVQVTISTGISTILQKILEIEDVSFNGTPCTDYASIEAAIQSMFYATGGGVGYKVYTALLNQSGTDDPVATVLENTLGEDAVWTRDSAGYYFGTVVQMLDQFKLFLNISIGERNGVVVMGGGWNDDNSIYVGTSIAGVFSDDLMVFSTIEIRVYP